jgi:RNA polymerase sigma-B factor
VKTATETLLRARAALPAGHPDRERLRRAAIVAGLPLARQLARRYAGRGEPLDDLVQVASLALVRAVADYDPARNDSFAGYAVPTILGRLKNHFRDHTWDIRVPRRLREVAASRDAATAELAQRLRHIPTTPELADHLRVDGNALAAAAYVAQLHRLASLDAAEYLDAPGAEDPGYARVDNRLSLRPLLAALPPREREILAMRYFDEQTLAQIADRVGGSPTTVARLVRRSLTTLRAGLPP